MVEFLPEPKNDQARMAAYADLIQFVEKNQPCEYSKIIAYLSKGIEKEGIIPRNESTVKSWITKSVKEGRLNKNGKGQYITTMIIPPAPRYRKFESSQVLSSPFGKVNLYVMEGGAPDSLARFQEYIARKIKLQYGIRALRLRQTVKSSTMEAGNYYRYAVLIFEKDLLKEVYLNVDKTSDFSGEGGHWHRKVENFLSENRIETDTVDGGLEMESGEAIDLLKRHLSENNML